LSTCCSTARYIATSDIKISWHRKTEKIEINSWKTKKNIKYSTNTRQNFLIDKKNYFYKINREINSNGKDK